MRLQDIYNADENAHRGIVYFITADDDTVKVGYTTHLGKRFADLKTGSSKAMAIMDYVRADKRVEAAIHKELQSERLSGEWFKETDKTLDLLYLISDFVETFDDNDEDTDGRDAHIFTVEELHDIIARPYFWRADD